MSQAIETQYGTVRRLDLLDVLLVFAERKWLILGWALAGLVIAIIAILRAPTLYKSQGTIMPPQQEQSSAALLSQLGLTEHVASRTVPAPFENGATPAP